MQKHEVTSNVVLTNKMFLESHQVMFTLSRNDSLFRLPYYYIFPFSKISTDLYFQFSQLPKGGLAYKKYFIDGYHHVKFGKFCESVSFISTP